MKPTDEDRAEADRLKWNDMFCQEAERLAKLPASDRKEALAVHQRIADNTRYPQVIRDYARKVAYTLDYLIQKIRRKRKKKT